MLGKDPLIRDAEVLQQSFFALCATNPTFIDFLRTGDSLSGGLYGPSEFFRLQSYIGNQPDAQVKR